MRRFGNPRQQTRKYVRRPGAYGIIQKDGDLLLTLQDADELELQLPGGGIDPDESPVRALHREVFEETGYHISDVRRLGAYQRFVYIPEYDMWAHKICHIFICIPTLRISEPPELEHTAIWMDPAFALDRLSNDGDRHFLRRWLL